MLAAPSVLTLPGRPAQLRVGSVANLGGKSPFLGDTVNCLAALAADGQSMNLDLTAEYSASTTAKSP